MNLKTLNTCLLSLIIILTCWVWVAQAAPPAVDSAQTFTGEIMDDLCAKYKSHDKMMQEMKSMTNDPVICTKKCVELGAHYVLYDRQKDAMYKLDNPQKAEPFAGKTVQISGTLQKNKIKIANIEAIGSSGAK